MKRLAGFLCAVFVWASPATAQSVQQSGTITPGHAVRWVTNGIIGDAGTAASGTLTSLGVTNNGGPGVCVNSGPITSLYNSICLQVGPTTGGQIVVTNHSGATGGFQLILNGVAQGLATVNLPVSNNQLACFADSSGTLKGCSDINNPFFTGTISLDGFPFAKIVGNYTTIDDPTASPGHIALALGNIIDPNNYYANTGHIFQARDNATTYARINSTGIQPGSDNTKSLGTQSLSWQDIYTHSLLMLPPTNSITATYPGDMTARNTYITGTSLNQFLNFGGTEQTFQLGVPVTSTLGTNPSGLFNFTTQYCQHTADWNRINPIGVPQSGGQGPIISGGNIPAGDDGFCAITTQAFRFESYNQTPAIGSNSAALTGNVITGITGTCPLSGYTAGQTAQVVYWKNLSSSSYELVYGQAKADGSGQIPCTLTSSLATPGYFVQSTGTTGLWHDAEYTIPVANSFPDGVQFVYIQHIDVPLGERVNMDGSTIYYTRNALTHAFAASSFLYNEVFQGPTYDAGASSGISRIGNGHNYVGRGTYIADPDAAAPLGGHYISTISGSKGMQMWQENGIFFQKNDLTLTADKGTGSISTFETWVGAVNSSTGFGLKQTGTVGSIFDAFTGINAITWKVNSGILNVGINTTAITGAILDVKATNDEHLIILPKQTLSDGIALNSVNDLNTLSKGMELFASEFLFSSGGIVVGAPTGSTQGIGTINATGYYVNGVLINGTVTSIATTSPISGGTIVTSGTISCPTCVTSAASLASGSVVLGASGKAISALSTVNGALLNTSSSGVVSFTQTPSLGVIGATTGTLAFNGGTNGVVTITPQSAAGTATFTLPNTSGTPAISVPTPLTLSPVSGGVTWTGLTPGGLFYGSSATAVGLTGTGSTVTVLHGSAGGTPTFGSVVSADMNITATSCSNQFVSSISSGGVGTCTTPVLAGAQFANQGTTTTVLHGNASGNPSFGSISLTADVTGILPNANGGSPTGAWTSYTPTVTTQGGDFTTAATAGFYQQQGKTVRYRGSLTTTVVGILASGYILMSLPVITASSTNQAATANSSEGKNYSINLAANSTQMYMYLYDGTFRASDGLAIYFNGTYEVP